MARLPTFDQRRLLAVSLEETLLSGEKASRKRLEQLINEQRDTILLLYFSKETLSKQLKQIVNHQLLRPDYIVSSLGTEIYRLPEENPLSEWEHYIQQAYAREAIEKLLKENFPYLKMQPPAQQTPLKISCMLENGEENIDDIRNAILNAGVSAKIYFYSQKFIDVVPERAGVASAVKYLVDSLVLNSSQVFVGSGREQDAELFQFGFHGIVVNNASEKLKNSFGINAYFSRNKYAQGLLEGLEYFDFFSPGFGTDKLSLPSEAYKRAIESLYRNITPIGFSAASLLNNPLTAEDSNYFAVWSRDGIKAGLWSQCLRDSELNDCFCRTLLLLAEHQTDGGQIPANVQIRSGTPDYGGVGNIASIDSVIWFVIGSARYAAHNRDVQFLKKMYPNLKLAMSWLRAHDSNNCGLLELPESSDWMDLFPRSYNVLYDEVLWYLACCDFVVVSEVLGEDPQDYSRLSELIRKKILRQFWPTAKKLSEAQESFAETQFMIGETHYLLSQISPFGFSWRCDVYANLLAALIGLLDENKMEQLFRFLWGVGVNSPFPVKCLYPPIHSGAQDWKDYFITNFLNLPDHYHNGGIWPYIGGLWVRFLRKIGRLELAHQELNKLAEACRMGSYNEWEFNEWLHGYTGRPMGKAHQTWSSASYIAAYKSLHEDFTGSDFAPIRPEMFEIR